MPVPVVEVKPAEPPKPQDTTPTVASTPKVEQKMPPPEPADNDTIRLGAMIEAGYFSNFGSVSGLSPGAAIQVSYRMGQLDLGGGLDLLVSVPLASQTGSVTVGSGQQIDTTTNNMSVQALVGPYARYRFTDLIGVAGQLGVGLSRVTQSITANGQVNSSGATNAFGFGGFVGLDLDLGLAQVFAGARYEQASGSGSLSGNAGGFAGIAGLGVDIGM